MKNTRAFGMRVFSVLLSAAVLFTTCIMPVSADTLVGDGVEPSCDEAYYATTDYYGNLTEGSVVKSYIMNGATSLTDYGTYDEVINLTDGTVPGSIDGGTTFDFASAAPSHFYFEGRTAAPFEALPWKLSVHYTLNGVPTKAEELAGKTGVVEIFFDAVPNKSADEYARNNYTLEAMAIFNQDDILSLEADGAQIQLIGNLRAVLFVILPGEEQHFSIRVGSDEFSFGGMTFMMVPATLSQLSEISKLSGKKDEIEENYRKLSKSLDLLLDSADGIKNNLYATADGLDELNTARGIISNGKENICDNTDTALGDLEMLNESLSKLTGRLDTAAEAVGVVDDSLDDVSYALHDLKKQLEDIKHDMGGLQLCLKRIRNSTSLARMISGINDFSGTADDLFDSLDDVLDTMDDLGDVIDTYAPGLQKTLIDTKTVVTAIMSTLTDTHSLINSTCNLLESADEPLDSGTKKTLEGLAESLRATADSINTTGNIKSAKNNISGIVEDVWNEYTGEVSNLLLIDTNDAPQSLTDSRNASPTSIQVLIRTQEIKEAEPQTGEIEIQKAAKTTFFQRVAQMFKDFRDTVTGIFH